MQKNYDVLIIGAGIIGLNTAHQLARRSKLKIAVLEKGRAVGEGSSGASSAICRHLYSHDEMICMARDGINLYRHWSDYLGLSNPRAGFQNTGVLWLGSERHIWEASTAQRLQKLGIPAEIIDADELSRRFPAINPSRSTPDFESGETPDGAPAEAHLFEPSGGYMDPQYAMEDLLGQVIAAGVDVLFETEVQQLIIEGDQVRGAIDQHQQRYSAATTLCATGPWTTNILQKLGIDGQWPLVPTRIQILYIDRPPELTGPIPVCADLASGIYFRPQNQQLIVGSTLPEDDLEAAPNPDDFNRQADDEFTMYKMHALHHRLPGLPYRGKIGSYAGLYTVNRADMHPILGPTPVDGLHIAAGFSGHGFKIAPAVGGLLARSLTGEAQADDTQVPIDFFSWNRVPLALDVKSVLA